MRIAARIKKLERSAIASVPAVPADRCAGCDRAVADCRMSFREVTAAFAALNFEEKVAALVRPAVHRCRFCGTELPPPPARPDADRLPYVEFAARGDAWERLGRDDQVAVAEVLFHRPGRLADMPMERRVEMLREWAVSARQAENEAKGESG